MLFLVPNRYSIDYSPSVVAVTVFLPCVSNHDLKFTLMNHPLLFHSSWCNLSVHLQHIVIMSANNPSIWLCLWINCWALYQDSASLIFTLWLLWPYFLRVQIIKMRMIITPMPAWPRHPRERRLNDCYFNERWKDSYNWIGR